MFNHLNIKLKASDSLFFFNQNNNFRFIKEVIYGYRIKIVKTALTPQARYLD